MINQVLPRSCRGEPRYNGFTLIELVLVVGIITVLGALVLSTVGYARKKGALARAETEIAALSAACENYKADNGIYPSNPDTNNLDPRTGGNPSSPSYSLTSFYLYTQLSGDTIGNRTPTGKSYMQFKPNMLFPADQTLNVQYIQDPFGYSYGYSTSNQVDPTRGYNPTFDLWSTASGTTIGDAPKWIKNW
jgi:prepilin-type N-terminal cleavage/methylation domain-containing protein